MENNDYTISHTTFDEITVVYDEENNAIVFVIENLMAKFHSDSVIVEKGILKASGKVEADLYKVHMEVGINLNTTNATTDGIPNELLLPHILGFGVKMEADRKHVSITVTESIYDNFADLIAEIFVDPICTVVEDTVYDVLMYYIPKILNKKIKNRNGVRAPLKNDYTFKDTALDVTIPYAWKVTKEVISVYHKGAMYTTYNYTEVGVQEPALPLWNPNCDKHL